MIHIMEGVIERGTAKKLKVLNRPIAGKTGTTNDEKDAWFIGFTPDLASAYSSASTILHPWPWRDRGQCLRASGPRLLQDRAGRPAANSVPRSAWHQARAREFEDRLAGRSWRPQSDHGGFQAPQEPLGAVATDDAGSPEGLAAEEYGQAGPAAHSRCRSWPGRRAAATAVHRVQKAPGRHGVQGARHGGTTTTIACARAVGAYIRHASLAVTCWQSARLTQLG